MLTYSFLITLIVSFYCFMIIHSITNIGIRSKLQNSPSPSELLQLIPKNVEYNTTTLLNKIYSNSNSGQCILIFAGAEWDGHFKHWVNSDKWKLLLDQINNSTYSWNKNVSITNTIHFGYILTNKHKLPEIGTWKGQSFGSYIIKLFRNGAMVDNNGLELIRSPLNHDWNSILYQLQQSCDGDGD